MRGGWTSLPFVLGLAACSDAPIAATAAAETPAAAAGPEAVSTIPAAQADAETPPLSEEDLRLIAADPKTLSREERKARAYALRRKIMQNPDSPAARSLRELARAHRAGEIEPQLPGERTYPTFSLPGHERPQGRRVGDDDDAAVASTPGP